jgi:hypothetical protein
MKLTISSRKAENIQEDIVSWRRQLKSIPELDMAQNLFLVRALLQPEPLSPNFNQGKGIVMFICLSDNRYSIISIIAVILFSILTPASAEADKYNNDMDKFEYVLSMPDLSAIQKKRIERIVGHMEETMTQFKKAKWAAKQGQFMGNNSSNIGEALLAATVRAPVPELAAEQKGGSNAARKKASNKTKYDFRNDPTMKNLKERMKSARRDSWNQIMHILTPEQRNKLTRFPYRDRHK